MMLSSSFRRVYTLGARFSQRQRLCRGVTGLADGGRMWGALKHAWPSPCVAVHPLPKSNQLSFFATTAADDTSTQEPASVEEHQAKTHKEWCENADNTHSPNWEKRIFEQTQMPYFYNTITHEIMPIVSDEDEDGQHPSLPSLYDPPSVALEQKDGTVFRELRFKEYKNLKDDRPYYLNLVSLECTWKFPFEDQDVVLDIPPLPQFEWQHRVPKETPNAPMARRIGAAFIDLSVSFVTTVGMMTIMYYDLGGEIYTALPAGGPLFMATFLARDTVMDIGTRSLGKKVMKLEVISDDGILPHRGKSIFRNVYVAPMAFGAALYPPAAVAFLGDIGVAFGTGKRVGDYMAGTRVISELPDRQERLDERVAYIAREVRMT